MNSAKKKGSVWIKPKLFLSKCFVICITVQLNDKAINTKAIIFCLFFLKVCSASVSKRTQKKLQLQSTQTGQKTPKKPRVIKSIGAFC